MQTYAKLATVTHLTLGNNYRYYHNIKECVPNSVKHLHFDDSFN